ncbi:multi-copper polyphenol oxidoreductase laccase family protein, partial [Yersinia pestis PY-89]
MGKH